MRRELTITRLGSKGDGIAEPENGPVYVPFTLPGERIVADVDDSRGQLLDVTHSASERIEPICQHFGACGGCALQHLDWKHYLDWKRARIVEAMRLAGVDADALVEPVRAFGPHSRRRATFAACKTGKTLQFGFRRALSHDIIDFAECPILLPDFEAALPNFRELLSQLLPQGEARVMVTACDNGFDVGIDAKSRGEFRLRQKLGDAAAASSVIRITVGGDPLLSLATPQVTLAGVKVDLPAGAFLQASQEAEAAMADLALSMTGKAKRVADLFCGLGAFSFALAKRANVTAIDNDGALMNAFSHAARRAQGLKPINGQTRDLMRDPLSPLELNRFDAVLFDPPRAGALAQANALAGSRVPKVIAVSCHPESFARDTRRLLEGGYSLKRVIPIDQFVYSAHTELVAELTRK